MLSQKRRKKRQSHGLRTIELQRGKQGYGFTISGQQPCVLGNIIPGSPADDQGMCVCVCYSVDCCMCKVHCSGLMGTPDDEHSSENHPQPI